MASRYKNLTIDQGSDFEYTTQVYGSKSTTTPTPTDNYTANAQMRKSYYHTNAVVTFDITNVTGDDTFTMAANNKITAAVAPGKYVYDMEITQTSGSFKRTRVLEGIITVTPEVTKIG